MNAAIEFVVRSIAIGAGATIVMDVWAAVLRRFGVPSLNFAFLGRWIGHLVRGRWSHESISKTPPIQRELLLGWSVHYSIGITFAALLLAVFGVQWGRSPTLPPAMLIGLMTAVAPLFVLQPAFGAGIASSKTPRPAFNTLKSLVTHTISDSGSSWRPGRRQLSFRRATEYDSACLGIRANGARRLAVSLGTWPKTGGEGQGKVSREQRCDCVERSSRDALGPGRVVRDQQGGR